MRGYKFVLPAVIAVGLLGSSAAQSTTSAPGQHATPAPDAKTYFVELVSLPDVATTRRMGGPVYSVSLPSTKAVQIASALGSDDEFKLQPVGGDRIAIYYKGKTRPGANPAGLAELKSAIQTLARADSQSWEVIRVRPGQSDATAKSVNALQLPGITAIAFGRGAIGLMTEGGSNPVLLAELRRSIFDSRWELPVFSPVQRLFHLDAGNVVKSLSASGDSGGAADKPAPKSDKPAGSTSSTGPSATSTASPTVTATPSVTVSLNTAAPAPKPADQANSGDPKPGASTDATKPAAGGKGGASPDAMAMAGSGTKPPTMQAVGDTLVYSNADGSDSGIMERNRLMAVLDLPRPEVLMNLWSLQASSHDARVVNADAEVARQMVAHHNEILQESIDNGWKYLSSRMVDKDESGYSTFFDRPFYNYVTQKFATAVDDTEFGAEKPGNALQYVSRNRANWGWCDDRHYCLGFTHAFEPLRPTFTNILLAITAAEDPKNESKALIAAMQKKQREEVLPLSKSCGDDCPPPDYSEITGFRKCICKSRLEIELVMRENAPDDCQLQDRREIMLAIEAGEPEKLRLNCFSKQANESFDNNGPEYETTRVGLLRAAIADFLFNYKWATQYPHDFIPYDLSQSAQELNAELNPLILAFNNDVAAFTQNLQEELQCKQDLSERHPWFGAGDETFLNNGMIAVRGISGVESIVDTVTQSFFNATKPPSLTDLVKSVSDAEKNVPGVLSTNLTANEAAVLLGALNSVQPAEAKIGRELRLDITPHALAGASSAELEVNLTAEESGNPTYFTASTSTEDNLSRVAKHDTTTKVRVDSLKLFEVSAFSAMLQRPRSKFPLLPPLFEVPYFGSFIGVPIPGAKVYHRSSAIVSAVIVPTAADLAYGIDFTADRVCESAPDAGVVCHPAGSISDFQGLPMRNYHKAIVQCFASSQKHAYTGKLAFQASAKDAGCSGLDFRNVPPADAAIR